MIKVSFFTDEVSKDFDEAVRLGVEAGAEALEIRGGLWGKSVTTIDDDDVKRMQDVLAKYNAQVACIGSPVGKCHYDRKEEYETHLRYFDRMVELAHAFNTKVIRVFSFWKVKEGEDRPYLERYLDTFAQLLEPIVKTAEAEGVVLAFETEGSTMVGTCREARMIIEALGGGEALTVCWDVINSYRCGELPYPDGYSQIKGLISHFHVKPNRDKELNPVGETELTYQQLFNLALEDGFKGAATIEHWGSPELMLKGIRQLREAIDGMKR
jgi:sugar phosphate isomerase/epimerase